MAAPKIYGYNALIGGALYALDSLDGTGLNDGDMAFVLTSAGIKYEYRLNATSGAAESSPWIISPNTNAGNKRWILINNGTWTPIVTFGGGSTGITYSGQSGLWKVSDGWCTVCARVVFTNKGSSTGAALVTNFPFVCYNDVAATSPIIIKPTNITYTGQIAGVMVYNTSTCNFTYVNEAGAQGGVTDANFANNSNFILYATYKIAS